MKALLIATHNQGKVREYRDLLAGLPYRLLSLHDVGIDVPAAETGASFAANATAKAQFYAARSGLLTLADDSGLEVDALGGQPGIHSARYAGAGAADAQNVALLLQQLQGVPASGRQARFRCVIALAAPGGRVELSEGTVEGLIAERPRGEHGFGYDPVFLLPERGLTMAELPPEEKNRISHRAVAARKARTVLERWHRTAPGKG